jgi:hypothetical protein
LSIAFRRQTPFVPSGMWQLCKEFLRFLREEKKWWLLPLVLILAGLAMLLLFRQNGAIAPFMYGHGP